MREPIRDKERLCHILTAIQRIQEGTSCNANSLSENTLEYFGVVKLIEVIGEAVYKLSIEFKDTHSDTPWRAIERMRHVLVHGYYTVGVDFIREVVEHDLPPLKRQISDYIDQLVNKL